MVLKAVDAMRRQKCRRGTHECVRHITRNTGLSSVRAPHVYRGEFGLKLSDREIDQCVAIMKAKGTGDEPHPFFA